jgi:hypothetical protein
VADPILADVRPSQVLLLLIRRPLVGVTNRQNSAADYLQIAPADCSTLVKEKQKRSYTSYRQQEHYWRMHIICNPSYYAEANASRVLIGIGFSGFPD